MKFIVALCTICLPGALPAPAVGNGGPSKKGDAHGTTASAKFMNKMVHHSNAHHVHKALKHHHKMSGDSQTRAIQQEVENMVNRVHKLNDPDTTAEFAKQLGGVEASLTVKGGKDQKLMNEISMVRAELCVEAGFERTEYDDCEDFMKSQCSLADKRKVVVPATYCSSFFAEESAKQRGATAPAPSVAASPGPAPGPAGAQMLYNKEIQPLQEQGFAGDLVEHEDMMTHTSDWRKEFGPKSGQRSYREICADNPGNEWCRLHGYFDEEEPLHAGASTLQGFGMAFATLLLSLGALC